MRAVIALVVLAVAGLCSPVAHAWNCSNPLSERVLVPAGTAGTYGDGDGQLAEYNGQLYECETVPVAPPAPSTPASTSKSKSSSTANSASNSTSNSASSASNNTSVVAKGGNASATGGSVGNISTTQSQTQSQSLSNSGNSKSSATGGSANGSGNSSNSYVNAVNNPAQTPSAMAPPILPTVPCFKGYSGGASTSAFGVSFGGGKIDENCAELEAARVGLASGNHVAFCKVYLLNKYVRKAGVTMEDCLSLPEPSVTVEQGPATVIPEPTPAPQPVITINVPAPSVVIIPPPVVAPPPSITAASSAALAAKVHHHGKPCPVVDNDSIKKPSGS